MAETVRSQTVLAYWLLPASPAQEFFRETINRLATACDAPIFQPHLTLAVGPDSGAEAHRILTGIVSGPIELRAAGIRFAPQFTRTLFVRFDSSAELKRLQNSLGLERCGDPPFDPHVSLLYKNISTQKQSRFAAALRLPLKTATFDAVQVMRCRVPVATSADVASWEVVASRRLSVVTS